MTPARRPVVVVGDIAVDTVVRLAAAPAPNSDTAARITRGPGGAAANVAWWLAGTGVPVTLAARTGADADGRALREMFAARGVTMPVPTDPEAATAQIVVLVDAAGERTMLPDRGASLRLSAADVESIDWPAGGHLHLSGYPLLHPGPRAAALAAIRLARNAGLTVSVDPASVAPLREVGVPAFLEWTAGVDLILPNAEEAALLAGVDDPEAAALLLAKTYPVAVVTLGRDGALWAAGDRLHRAPALVIPGPVDTTGAGDAFAAGVLGAWLAGAAPKEALAAGAATAAECVASPGATGGTRL